MTNRRRVKEIVSLLAREHPDAKIALRYDDPLELLIATVLSAQSTDRTINEVTERLFKKYRIPADYASADLRTLEKDIKPSGFYHSKAKYLKGIGQTLVEKFDSKVPRTMEELTTLPGVARKTANVVLPNAFGIIEGVAVDTHVKRLAQRLGLSKNKDPDKIEKDLMELLPKNQWPRLTDLLIFHGRRVCMAKRPNCRGCIISKLCPSAFTFD